MRRLLLQIEPWDQTHIVAEPDFEVKLGDKVVVQMENCSDLAVVVGADKIENEDDRLVLKKIIRPAGEEDIKQYKKLNENRQGYLKYCQEAIQKYSLDMKLVDCHVSIDESRIIIGFISDGRVDFRELVKDLTRHYQKSVRLQQMGIRDEARLCGDIGPCGRELCCRRFLKQLTSVVSDYAKIQGVEHRGCERLSGICGRLKCCLTYELKTYQDLAKDIPALGQKIKTAKGVGVVSSQNILKQSVTVKLTNESYIEVPISKKQ